MKQGITRGAARLRQDPRNLFYLLSAAGILLYMLLSFRYGGALYAWLAQENAPEIRFVDYFSHMELVADPATLYQHVSWDADGSYAAVFPPLAYCMYLALYRMTAPLGGLPAGKTPEEVPGALSVLTVYLIFNAVFFYLAIARTGERSRRRDLAIFTLLMLSAVFLGSGLMLANSTVLVAALLLLALLLKDDPRPTAREGGLLLLAVCVAMKLYPAVFGLVFLKEKKYRQLARLILYSAVLFIVPFVFFGGRAGLAAWFRNLTGPLQSADFYGRPQFLQGVFCTLARTLTGQDLPGLCKVLTWVVSLLWVLLAWRSRSPIRTVFFLICVMVFFPANAYRYTLAYFAIPLVMMLKQPTREQGRGWTVGIISALYGLLFTIPTWWLLVFPMEKRFSVHTLTSVEIWVYMAAWALVLAETAAELTEKKAGKGQKLSRS